MFAVKLNEKVYNFFNEIILCFFRSINKANSKQNKCGSCNGLKGMTKEGAGGEEKGKGGKETRQLERKTCMQLAGQKEKRKDLLFRTHKTKHICMYVCV